MAVTARVTKTSKKRLRQRAYLFIFLILLPISLFAEVKLVTLKAGTYTLRKDSNEDYKIIMPGFGTISTPGAPHLPAKLFYIKLPENAKISHITYETSTERLISIEGKIKSSNPMIPLEKNDDMYKKSFADFQEQEEQIYESNAFYPNSHIKERGIGNLANMPVVKIQFFPFVYNPVTNKILFAEEATIHIEYTVTNEMHSKSAYENKVYPEYGQLFQTAPQQVSQGTESSMIIISSESLADVIRPFMFWKSCLGIRTEFVAIEQIISQYAGADKSEQVLHFLQDRYYNGDKFDNVLLIGHRDIIPIKKMYPNPDNHGGSGEVPSDIYFTDLNGNWDSDGDGFPGEYEEDDFNWFPEIHVGRIPWSDVESVRNILKKIEVYEKDRGGWKRNSFLLGAINSFQYEDNHNYYFRDTDGAYLMEILKSDVFKNGSTITSYEKGGIDTSSFECDIPLSNNDTHTVWSSGSVGCITWWAHGSSKSAYRKYWVSDNGNDIPESSEIKYEKFISIDDLPNPGPNQPVIFANACDNGWPEKTSLARKLLQNSCTGIVASSRLSFAVIAWNEVSDGGNASLTYYFWKEFVSNAQRAGEALSYAKLNYAANHNNSWYDYHNLYAYNFYGDPSISINDPDLLYGGINGDVKNEDGTPASGVKISIQGVNKTVTTDVNGSFFITQVTPGTHHITISNESGILEEESADIEAGSLTSLEIVLHEPKSVSLSISQTSIQETVHEMSNTSTQLTLLNTGNTSVKYTVQYDSQSVPWLSINTCSDSLKEGESCTINIIFDTKFLQQGKYSTHIQCTTFPKSDSIFLIPVNLTVIDTIAPCPISDLEIAGAAQDSVMLRWTAPGDNLSEGCAAEYQILICNQPFSSMTSADTSQSTIFTFVPDSAGSLEEYKFASSIIENHWVSVKTYDETGLFSISNEIFLQTTDVSKPVSAKPEQFILQNYPNPFNCQTNIKFSLANTGHAKLTLFDEMGREINTLVDRNLSAGSHTAVWDGRDRLGRSVSSGIYIYRLIIDSKQFIKKMMLVK